MYDTIIIGAGTAGCVLANRLSADPARKVLVLEAGRAPPLASDIPSDWVTMIDTPADWGFHTVPQAGCRGRRIAWPRGKMVGGSGALNAMIYMRGLPSDYDGWAALGCPGWSWRDVLPVFRAMEANERLGNDPLHGSGGPLPVSDPAYLDRGEHLWLAAAEAAGLKRNDDFNGVSQEGAGFFQFTIKDGERFGTGKAYLRPALERPNLTVRTGVLTTRILVEKGRAVGVTYLDRGRPETVFASAEVVLSSGAIGSCHLLLLSGIGPAEELRRAGVEPVHHLPGVGKDLQDHVNILIPFAASRPVGLGALSAADWEASFQEWQATRSGLRTSAWAAAGAHVRTKAAVEPDLQLYGILSPHRDHGRFLHAGPGLTLHATLQRPKSRGDIVLHSADPIEAPAIDPRYFEGDSSGTDLATLVEGVRLNRRIAAQPPLAAVIDRELPPSAEAQSDDAIAHYIRGHCTTLYHPTSTCRMGTDAMAVVDPSTMRVHGLDGLRIADASVFPRMVSGNINTPTIMVAERAARMMLG